MKKLILLLILCITLVGCGNNGVPQEDYDAVVSEIDGLKEDFKTMEKIYDAKLQLSEWESQINSDYEWLMFFFDFVEKMGSDMNSSKADAFTAKSTIDLAISTLETTLDTFINNNDMELAEEFDFDAALDEIEKAISSWESMVNAIHSSL